MPQSEPPLMRSGIAFVEPAIVDLEDPRFDKKGIKVSMLRLDQIHQIVSGNKLYKLFYFLEEAERTPDKRIVTFGGAYSNHLAATAFATEQLHMKSVGIVRGQKPKELSHTLQFCMEHGMHLEFVSRSLYKNYNQDFLTYLQNRFGQHVLVPEGGFSVKGKRGASLIGNYFGDTDFSHVCLAVGTATTFAGLVEANNRKREIIGFAVLKNMTDLEQRFKHLQVDPSKTYSFLGDYHFGGYAKKADQLLLFMNRFYSHHLIALDFVYTGKMMFGVYDLIDKGYFKPGAKILCIHTGGLQGNDSLPEGALNY